MYVELINIVRHMRAFPEDSLENTLRNVFDFDVYKPEAIDYLLEVFNRHGFVGLCHISSRAFNLTRL